MRYEICGDVVRDVNAAPGDVVCINPANDAYSAYSYSAEAWEENARKIVAALNWVEATGLTFEQVEKTLAAIEASRRPVEIEQVKFRKPDEGDRLCKGCRQNGCTNSADCIWNTKA